MKNFFAQVAFFSFGGVGSNIDLILGFFGTSIPKAVCAPSGD
jgi:hypothetical protein